MSDIDVELTLRQMVRYIDAAESFVVGRERTELDRDLQLEFALCRALEVLGEGARRIPEEAVADHPEIPWRGVIAMRNFLAHGYDHVDLDVVWRVVTEDLPPLRLKPTEWLHGLSTPAPSAEEGLR